MPLSCRLSFISLLLLAFGGGALAQAPAYTVTGFLGRLPGNYPTQMCLSDDGVLTGNLSDGVSFLDGFIYENGALSYFGDLTGGQRGIIYQRNRSGQMVGQLIDGSSEHGFFYEGGSVTTFTQGVATAINDAGQAVINSSQGIELYQNGSTSVLGNYTGLGGGNRAYGFDINESGAIVGRTTVYSETRAFLYDGSFQILPSLSFPSAMEGLAVNDSGMVIGRDWDSATKRFKAFEYAAGASSYIPFAGAQHIFAYDVNNAGQVVGDALPFGGFGTPFVYRNGVAQDLNTLIAPGSGWFLGDPLAINNSGQIAGVGYLNGSLGIYLLSPNVAPEPAPLTLLALALPLAGYTARRRL